MTHNKTALILGATGGIGGAVAAALQKRGWAVRGLVRKVEGAKSEARDIAWIAGDAMVREDVVRAAMGTSVIVHAVNPPGYQNWEKLVLPMIDNSIVAAKAAGARVVLPGTIYNFDPKTTPVIDAATPQNPPSRKGVIRAELEKRLERGAREGVPAMILRAGDFFGPNARSSWFSQAMIAPGKTVTRIVDTARSAGHSWAYLPDLAEAFARAIEAEDRLLPFERVQFEGFYDASGTGMIEAIRKALGRDVPVRKFPWWMMTLASPFGGFPREASEIAQYWAHPLKLDNRRLVELIGTEPRTGLNLAVKETLKGLGAV